MPLVPDGRARLSVMNSTGQTRSEPIVIDSGSDSDGDSWKPSNTAKSATSEPDSQSIRSNTASSKSARSTISNAHTQPTDEAVDRGAYHAADIEAISREPSSHLTQVAVLSNMHSVLPKLLPTSQGIDDEITQTLHTRIDLFTHSARDLFDDEILYCRSHRQDGVCDTCYKHNFDSDNWNPANHEAILRNVPRLRQKEAEDLRSIRQASKEIYECSQNPSLDDALWRSHTNSGSDAHENSTNKCYTLIDKHEDGSADDNNEQQTQGEH